MSILEVKNITKKFDNTMILKGIDFSMEEGEVFSLASARFLASEKTSPSSDYIFHYTNEGECTWYEFAKTIAEYAGHTGCEIRPCTSDEFPSKVHRPAYSVLDKSKIKSALGISIPHWTDSLKKCLGSL